MDTTAATKRVLPSGRYDRAGKSAFEVLEKAHKALGGCYLFFYTGNIRSRIIYGCSSFQFLRLYGDREFLLEIREFFSRRLDGTSIRNETLKMWTVVPALHGSAATALPYHPNPKQGSKAHFKKLFKELDSLKDKKTPYILFWLPALEIKIQKAYPEDLGDEVFKSSAWMKWTTDTDIIMNILPIEKVMWEDRRPFQRQRTMPASRTQTVLCEFSGSGDNLDVLSAVDDQMQLDTESEYAADTPEWLDIESKRCNSPVRLTPVCCDGDRYVVVMPSVDAPKRGGKKLGCPLMVSLSLYCEGESTIAQYNCQCSPFRTLGTCVHVQLYEKKAAYIASLDFPKNTIAPFYNGMGDVAGYYVPDQGILSRESVVLCPRPGRGDDDWRCCDPEHRDSCLHIIHAKEHRNSQGGTGISSRRGMNGVSGRRVPVEEFLSKVRSDSDLAFAPVPLPSMPADDDQLQIAMENLRLDGHYRFAHNRKVRADELVLQGITNCHPNDIWGEVPAGIDFLAPFHYGECPQCEMSPMRLTLISKKFKVYLESPHRAHVYALCSLRCQRDACGHEVFYNGKDDGIFVASKEIGVSLELLYRAHEQFLAGNALETTRKFIADTYDKFAPRYKKQDFLGETAWRDVFYKFAYALQDPMKFCCPHCLNAPKIIIADGTAITINIAAFFGTPVISSTGGTLKSSEHRRSHRCFLKSHLGDKSKVVELLQKLSATLNDDPSAKEFTGNDWSTLIAKAEPYRLKEFLLWTKENRQTWTPLACKTMAIFLGRNLATDSLVLAYFPHSVATMFDTVLRQEGDEHKLDQLTVDMCHKWSPIVHSVLQLAKGERDHFIIDKNLKILMAALVARATECVAGNGIDKATPIETPSQATAEDVDACISSGILCGLRQLRHRPAFDIDKKGSEETGTKAGCRKRFNGGGGKTGGIFTVFCEHGVCLAAMMMPNAEGRNELFSWMVKYLEKPPDVVVYDYACALHEYCINRMPNFFKDTIFLVDRLHWFNHKSCCSSYSINAYEWLSNVNSVICEQNNSALGRIERTLSRAAQGSFMLLIRRFMYDWNSKKIKQMHARGLISQQQYLIAMGEMHGNENNGGNEHEMVAVDGGDGREEEMNDVGNGDGAELRHMHYS